VDRTFYDVDEFGFLFKTGQQARSVTALTLSSIGDNTLWGYFGPINGRRYNLRFQESFDITPTSLPYHTATLDARRYYDLRRGYTFASRILAGASVGRNPQTFRLGGYSTLRGYPDFSLFGSHVIMGSLEIRFPFIQTLGVVGPLPVGMFNLRGVVFTDVASIWSQGEKIRLSEVVDGRRRLLDPLTGPGTGLDFGTGLRTSFMFMILKFDVAWRTDMVGTSRPVYSFSLGPEF